MNKSIFGKINLRIFKIIFFILWAGFSGIIAKIIFEWLGTYNWYSFLIAYCFGFGMTKFIIYKYKA
jgi:hypothetical protein